MTPLFGFLDNPLMLLILGALGVLLFGRKLPEVGRSLGKGLAEFRKGLKGIEDDIDGPTNTNRYEAPPQQQELPRPPQRVTPTAPKFEDVSPAPTAPKFEDGSAPTAHP